ncbi:MAG: tyrosine--tRNA ligase [Gemmatimonadetes bacterium]|nr:tyrosine--tRNA ligase [Candidatus Palauibacter rhopaloidicola]
MFLPVDEQIRRIRAGAESIVPEHELVAKLERSAREDRPLLIKQGFDPTRPDLHIGHGVSIHKLRTFQELGHRVVFVMGDFTARVGDPSGRDETRPMLSEEEIESNLATYEDQVFRILDPAATEIRKNSEWLAGLALADILRLTSQYTVARMLERDDFAARHREGRPISLVEFLYPMMQAYDSVALRADVELGGTDQRFNLLLGRTLQERAGQEPQVCLIMPLLRGTDGHRKMSKSYGNYVGIAMEAAETFGRVMSIPDTLLDEWLVLVSSASGEELATRRAQAETDPLAAKRWLAGDLVARYHGAAAAGEAREAFDRLHRRREVPEDVPVVSLSLGKGETRWIAHILRDSGLAASSSEAGRLIRQGAVRVDGSVVREGDLRLGEGEYLVQRGKRAFARISLRS